MRMWNDIHFSRVYLPEYPAPGPRHQPYERPKLDTGDQKVVKTVPFRR